MREHPIIFSAEMIRAILDGRKTMTRRVIKPQPTAVYYVHSENPVQVMEWKGTRWYPATSAWGAPNPGDHLWLKETFTIGPRDGDIIYAADPKWDINGKPLPPAGSVWRPSRYMPKDLSRITLEVEAVRVERLQDITAEDVLKEGVNFLGQLPAPFAVPGMSREKAELLIKKIAQDQFRALWDSLNAHGECSWSSNPFVWRIEFRRLD